MLTLPGHCSPARSLRNAVYDPTWRKAQLLLVGAILTPRTVAAALRVMGRSDQRDYARYHEVPIGRCGRPARQRASCWCCCSSTWMVATAH